jgi:hypothetical protein
VTGAGCDVFWEEDPLPTPSSPLDQPFQVGEVVAYWRKGNRHHGRVTYIDPSGLLAKVDGHPGAFPVLTVLVSKLRHV